MSKRSFCYNAEKQKVWEKVKEQTNKQTNALILSSLPPTQMWMLLGKETQKIMLKIFTRKTHFFVKIFYPTKIYFWNSNVGHTFYSFVLFYFEWNISINKFETLSLVGSSNVFEKKKFHISMKWFISSTLPSLFTSDTIF
jgi:hypothetical protein